MTLKETVKLAAKSLLPLAVSAMGQVARAEAIAPRNPEEMHSVVVRLETEDLRGFCSGSYISDSLILTAAHCVAGIPRNVVILADSVSVEILHVDEMRDVAILQTPKKRTKWLALAPRGSQTYFRPVMAFGYPFGMFANTEVGLLYPEKQENPFRATSSVRGVGPGMSGGPLLDAETGAIVGVTSTGIFQQMVPSMNTIGGFMILEAIYHVLDVVKGTVKTKGNKTAEMNGTKYSTTPKGVTK